MTMLIGTIASGITKSKLTSFESIATASIDGSLPQSVTFSSIPNTYKNLQIRIFGRAGGFQTSSRSVNLFYNNDKTSLTRYHRMYYVSNGFIGADGSQSGAGNIFVGQFAAAGGMLSNTGGVAIIDIIDYASTSKTKVTRSISGINVNSTSQSAMEIVTAYWPITNAISSIELQLGDGWSNISSIALYGIKG